MDPITLATVALTLIATKSTEKVGEILGESVVLSARNLLRVLRKKSPETVSQIESASNEPDVIEAEIVPEIRRVAELEPEVREALDSTTEAMQEKLSSVTNKEKLAEKIGFVFQGGYNPIRIEKFEI